jgi:hypothetical protein
MRPNGKPKDDDEGGKKSINGRSKQIFKRTPRL